MTAVWFGATPYTAPREIPRDPDRGLDAALDALDEARLCCCWVAGRTHDRDR